MNKVQIYDVNEHTEQDKLNECLGEKTIEVLLELRKIAEEYNVDAEDLLIQFNDGINVLIESELYKWYKEDKPSMVGVVKLPYNVRRKLKIAKYSVPIRNMKLKLLRWIYER